MAGIVAHRIAHICDLMRCYAWGASMRRDCIDAWDLSEPYVRQLEREAARRVFGEVTDPQLVSVNVGQSLARAIEAAEEAKDWRTVVQAGAVWYKMASLGGGDAGARPSEIPDDESIDPGGMP
jgi:hypothetical protein